MALCDGRGVFTINYLAIAAPSGTHCPSIAEHPLIRAVREIKLEACAVNIVDSEDTACMVKIIVLFAAAPINEKKCHQH